MAVAFEIGTETDRVYRGRGARSAPTGRFEPLTRHVFDDGWGGQDPASSPVRTQVSEETARTVITRNASPDISFDRSINPYRGCEHGCSYCYARPSHAHMGLSPGLDFETRLFAKTNAAEVLRRELARPAYRPALIALGANTDPYQPIERRYRLTRQILEVLDEFSHPVAIITKSATVLRDLDILKRLAERDLVKVAISLTTLDGGLARAMEPRAATPARRLHAIGELAGAGIPTAVMAAPMIPGLNDDEVERLVFAAAEAGASEAGYIVLRLPREVAGLFSQWLESAVPHRAGRVMALVRSLRSGRDYDPSWRRRMTGQGPYAWLLARRFHAACRRAGLNRRRFSPSLDHFARPPQPGQQLTLL